ncbi:MAG: hypothetical protein K2X00_23295 [Nitrospiraceae bacterium]|nr:hypothetical protein [Nitrospiraceae bacterium]
MTSTLITSDELKDLAIDALQSKFFRVSRDVARLRETSSELPLAEASLRNISAVLSARKLRAPKP